MNEARREVREFKRKAEQALKGNRPVPNGRNFVFWEHSETPSDRKAYRDGYDKIAWNSK